MANHPRAACRNFKTCDRLGQWVWLLAMGWLVVALGVGCSAGTDAADPSHDPGVLDNGAAYPDADAQDLPMDAVLDVPTDVAPDTAQDGDAPETDLDEGPCPEETSDCLVCVSEGDPSCHQCCEDADCTNVPGAVGNCEDHICTEGPSCQGMCTEGYPVCVTINGIEQCVQCSQDSHCQAINPSCTCNGEPLYSCIHGDGSACKSATDP